MASLSRCFCLPSRLPARRADGAQCANNLKQHGLALHAYHDANKAFPYGVAVPDKRYHGFIFWVDILPFIDQGTLHDAMRKTGVFRHIEKGSPAHNKQLQRLIAGPGRSRGSPAPSSGEEPMTLEPKYPGIIPRDMYFQAADYAGVAGSVKGRERNEHFGTNFVVKAFSGVLVEVVLDGGKYGWTSGVYHEPQRSRRAGPHRDDRGWNFADDDGRRDLGLVL